MSSTVRSVFLSVAALLSTALSAQTPVDGDRVISKSEQLSLDVADYRSHLLGREVNELSYLAEGDKALLDRALDFHSDTVLMQQAEALGLDEDPAIATKLADARRKILVMALMAKVRQDVTFSNAEALARERYLLKKDKLVTPERRHVAHILLTDRRDCACDKTPPALERAETLLKQIAAGDDFATLAAEQSADTASARQGGSIGWIEQNGETLQVFEDAAFALSKVGEVSEPVATRFGIHIIKLLEIDASRQLSFDDVRDQLIDEVKAAAVNSALEKARAQAYPDPASIDLPALRQVLGEARK